MTRQKERRVTEEQHKDEPQRRAWKTRVENVQPNPLLRRDAESADYSFERAKVLSRMPNVARNAVSDTTGKMLASFHCGSMSDQS